MGVRRPRRARPRRRACCPPTTCSASARPARRWCRPSSRRCAGSAASTSAPGPACSRCTCCAPGPRVVATDVSARACAVRPGDRGAQRRDARRPAGQPVRPACPASASTGWWPTCPSSSRPRRADVPTYTYRDAGLAGDDVVRRMLLGSPAHLAEGGLAQFLGNWEDRSDEGWRARLDGWVHEAAQALARTSDDVLDVWVVQRELADPALYAEAWISDGGRPGPGRGRGLVRRLARGLRGPRRGGGRLRHGDAAPPPRRPGHAAAAPPRRGARRGPGRLARRARRRADRSRRPRPGRRPRRPAGAAGHPARRGARGARAARPRPRGRGPAHGPPRRHPAPRPGGRGLDRAGRPGRRLRRRAERRAGGRRRSPSCSTSPRAACATGCCPAVRDLVAEGLLVLP